MALYDVKSNQELIIELQNCLDLVQVIESQINAAESMFRSVPQNSLEDGNVIFPYIQSTLDTLTTIYAEIDARVTAIYLDQLAVVEAGKGAVVNIKIQQAGGGNNGTFVAEDVFGNDISGAWNGFIAGDVVLVSGASIAGNNGYHTVAAIGAAYLELTRQDFTDEEDNPDMVVTLVQRDH